MRCCWSLRFCMLSFSPLLLEKGFLGGSDGKESACNSGDLGSIPRSGRSPGEGNGNPLQYSCLKNSMDRGIWWATVLGVINSQTQLSDFHSLTSYVSWVCFNLISLNFLFKSLYFFFFFFCLVGRRWTFWAASEHWWRSYLFCLPSCVWVGPEGVKPAIWHGLGISPLPCKKSLYRHQVDGSAYCNGSGTTRYNVVNKLKLTGRYYI